MKIGILTYFGDLNAGTNLQAYSIVKNLQEEYPFAEIQMINYQSFSRLWEWHPYISSISYASMKNDIRRMWKYYIFQKMFPLTKRRVVTDNYKKATKYINSFSFDAIFIGSDTLLELHRVKDDALSAFWLSEDIKCVKFIIAASARDTQYENISLKQKELMSQVINDLNLIAVRDHATFRLIKHFTKDNDRRLSIIPDPTFSLNIDPVFADKYAQRKGLINISKPIICLHLLKSNKFERELIRKLQGEGYFVVSLRPSKHSDMMLNDLSPFELLGIFKYFSSTITHRFHEAIFCYKNLSPVISFLPSKIYKNEMGESKYHSLHHSFGLDKTNLIDEIDNMNVEQIYNSIQVATTAFNHKKETIKRELINKNNQFKLFLRYTKSVLQKSE